MTLGFLDAVALSRAPSFAAYQRERDRGGRVAEVLAIALYDIFSGSSDETVAMRKAVYRLWRENPAECDRTMRLLCGDETNLLTFGAPFLKVLAQAGVGLVRSGVAASDARTGAAAAARLGRPARDWLASGALHVREAEVASPPAEPLPRVRIAHPEAAQEPSEPHDPQPAHALAGGISALLLQQDEDGSWEGECSWCAMLPAEYVLAWHTVTSR